MKTSFLAGSTLCTVLLSTTTHIRSFFHLRSVKEKKGKKKKITLSQHAVIL